MNISFRQLRAFSAVARLNSFTLAAESLFLTQSALSGLIRELEQIWDIKLFERTTRRLVLTEAGRSLLPKVNAILQQIQEVNNEAITHRAIYHGRIRIACSQQLAASLLPELIAEYQLIQPNSHIDIIDCGVEKVISLVDDDEADLGIGPEREERSNISSEHLFSLPFHAVLKKGHSLSQKKTLSWSDLTKETLITLKGPFSGLLSEQLHAKDRLLLNTATKVNYMSTALSMVNAGLGITICLPYSRKQIEQYNLSMKRLNNPTINRNFYIFQRKSAVLSQNCLAFKNFIVNSIKDNNLFA